MKQLNYYWKKADHNITDTNNKTSYEMTNSKGTIFIDDYLNST